MPIGVNQDDSSSLDLSNQTRRVGNHYIAIGDHADVWLADLDGVPGKVIMKMIRGGSTRNEKLKKQLLERGIIWHRFNHENVAKFYGFSFEHTYMPALIMPRYRHGNIMSFLKDHPEKSNEKRLGLIQGVAHGLRYLHSFDPPVVHGDIRGANILIDDHERAVLCDYGLAFVIVGADFTSVKSAGSCRWTAPEIMNPPDEETEAEYVDAYENDEPIVLFTTRSDVYALGMTILEIFSDAVPFAKKRNDTSVIFSVIEGRRPDMPGSLESQPNLATLVRQCWDQNPQLRPDVSQVCDILDAEMPPIPPSFFARFASAISFLRSWSPF